MSASASCALRLRGEPVAGGALVLGPLEQLAVRPLAGRGGAPGRAEDLEQLAEGGERAPVAHPAVVVPRKPVVGAGRLREALDELAPRRLAAQRQRLDHVWRHRQVHPALVRRGVHVHDAVAVAGLP